MRLFLLGILSFLFTLSIYASNPYCFFVSPKDWAIAKSDKEKSHVIVKFFDTREKDFSPSLNLAIEKVNVSAQEYLKAARKLVEKDPHKKWRSLGSIPTKAGDAVLTQIDCESPSLVSPVRILQAILIKDKNAYILTCASLKENMPRHYTQFRDAIKSLTITNDLIQCIPDILRKEKLNQIFMELGSSKDSLNIDHPLCQKLQSFITGEFEDMGTFWQLLLLQEIAEKFQIGLNIDKISKDA